MRIRVLGSAAGGGLPQWNCGCPNCVDARVGSPVVRPRTQSSIALSADGDRWALFNASPDIRIQIDGFPSLHPRGTRGSPLAVVLLTDAEVDHTAGLLILREGRELALSGTAFVRGALTANGLLATLESYLDVRWTEVVPGARLELRGADGSSLGLEVEAFEVPGDPPLYYRGDGKPSATGSSGSPPGRRTGLSDAPPAGHTIGVRVRAPGVAGELVYVPGAGAAEDALLASLSREDILIWDGTFWTDDELVRLGISERTASAMGHMPISGPAGSLERFRGVPATRKVYIHVNNTNPILREDSPPRRQVEAAGWEVAFDGMEFEI